MDNAKKIACTIQYSIYFTKGHTIAVYGYKVIEGVVSQKFYIPTALQYNKNLL
jgi:hypothetical protein